ncbi:hypothetical protein RND81_04G128500 [Saponaria officinalis]|uniref:Uncharacterized protein n=1 Tax=Saponaria officinalis TaxID=3572 RepID=A0AAW1LKK6_SAPOF
MADEGNLVDATNDPSTFPAADIDNELNPAKGKDFQVDSQSSKVAKEKLKRSEKKQRPKDDPMQTLKRSIIISGVILVVVGAAFAITKKMKEK